MLAQLNRTIQREKVKALKVHRKDAKAQSNSLCPSVHLCVIYQESRVKSQEPRTNTVRHPFGRVRTTFELLNLKLLNFPYHEESQSLPRRNTKSAASLLRKMVLVGVFLLLGVRGWGQVGLLDVIYNSSCVYNSNYSAVDRFYARPYADQCEFSMDERSGIYTFDSTHLGNYMTSNAPGLVNTKGQQVYTIYNNGILNSLKGLSMIYYYMFDILDNNGYPNECSSYNNPTIAFETPETMLSDEYTLYLKSFKEISQYKASYECSEKYLDFWESFNASFALNIHSLYQINYGTNGRYVKEGESFQFNCFRLLKDIENSYNGNSNMDYSSNYKFELEICYPSVSTSKWYVVESHYDYDPEDSAILELGYNSEYLNKEVKIRIKQTIGRENKTTEYVISNGGIHSFYSDTLSFIYLPALKIDSTKTSNISCNGGTDGFVTLYINNLPKSNGSSKYLYSIYRYSDTKSTAASYISTADDSILYGNKYYYFQTADTSVSGTTTTSNIKINSLKTGVYKIKVYSNENLFYPAEQIVEITEPAALQNSSYVIPKNGYGGTTYNVVTGSSTAQIAIAASGGTTPYYYSFNGTDYSAFSSAQTVSADVTASTTTVNVSLKDKNGCVPAENPKQITLLRADSIQLANFSKTDITCNYSDQGGSSNGTVSFNFSGGVGGYYLNFYNTDSSKTYKYSSSSNGNISYSGLAAGHYKLIITDATGGNSNTYTFTISQPPPLTINSITTPTIACYGDSATAVLYSQNSNITSYYASYNNTVESNNTGNFSKTLSPGSTYSFYITNTKGCQSSPVSQTMPAAPSAVVISAAVTNATCNGAANGSFTVTASGGWSYAGNKYIFGSTSYSENEHTYLSKTNGSYTVTVFDSLCKQGYTDTVKVGLVADSLQISQLSVTPDLCRYRQDGNASGAIEITIDKGDRETGGYTATLSHNGVETKKDIENNCTFGQLPYGSYTVTVKDSFGCSASGSTTIGFPTDTLRWASAPVTTNALCTGVANGKIALSAENGKGYYTYVLTDNNNNSYTLKAVKDTTFSGLGEGKYTLTVLDDSTCYVTDTAAVAANHTPVSFTNVAVTPYYCDNRKGSIIASSVSSGSTVTKLKLTFPNNITDSTENDSISYYRILTASGTYKIRAIDIHGCYADSSLYLKKYHNIPRVSVTSIDSAACSLASNGGYHFKATQDTAVGGFKFYLDDNAAFSSPESVSNNSDTAVFSGLTPKIYYIKVADSMSCDTSFRDTLPVIAKPVYIASQTLIPATCIRAANAGITLTAAGSMPQNPGYYFILDNDTLSGANVTFTKRVVDNSSHKVYLFDSFGCSDSTSAIFNSQSPTLTLTAPASVNPSCPGYSNGSLQLLSSYNDSSSTAFLYQVFKSDTLVASYTGGYDYSAGTLPQGTYKVVVTSADNCQDSIKNLTLTDPSPVNLFVSPGYVAAKGASTGWANALATAGNGKYVFEWYRNNTSSENFLSSRTSNDSAQITSLSAGNYIVRVKDTANCQYYNNSEWLPDTFKIKEPDAALALTLKSTDTVTCHGLSDGTFTLQGTGGWGSKYYYGSDLTFSNGTSAVFNGLPAGTYTFYVKDTSGVNAQATLVMAQPQTLSALVASVTDANCNGSSDGAINLSVTGGNTNYEVSSDNFSWQRGTVLNAIPAGSYTVTVRDNKKCTATAPATVNEPTAIAVTDTSITNTQCGVNEGVIIPTIEGGVPGYSYQWYNGATLMSTTSASVDSLYSGQYMLNVTDSHGCLKSFEFYVSDITDLNIDSIFAHAVTCWGYSDGWATVQISKGFPPYTKTWNSTYIGDTIAGLATGRYSFKVSDSEGCKVYQYYNIGTPDSLHIAGTITNPLCYGLTDGSIESLVNGGTEPYAYLWNTGRKKYNVTGRDTGTYTLNITDSHGCTKSGTFTLTYQERIQSGIPAALNLCKNNDYTIDGGDFESYLWKQNGTEVSTDRRITVTEQGTYTLDFEDSRGCKATDTTTVGLSDSQLQAQFLMASQVEQNDTVVIFEASDPIPDSIKIALPESFTVIDSGQYYRYVVVNDTGTFEITLLAYSGGCQAVVRKNIEVVEAGALPVSTQSSKASLIVSAEVRPNPTDGNFTTDITLSQSSEVYLRLISFGTGKIVNAKRISGSDQYTVHYSLGNLPPGVYLLNIMAGGEMKNLKIVIQ